MSQSSFQIFMAQTRSGESRWWSWVIGFWFALVIWFYGQIILGVLMVGVAVVTDPGVMDNLMATEQANTTFDPGQALLSLLLGLSPILPIILWLVRDAFKTIWTQRIAIGISALILAGTSAAFIQGNMNIPEGSADYTSQLIASHPLQYALILATFPVLALALWGTQKFIHRRTFLSLLTAAKRFRWKRMGFAMLVVWVILGVITYLSHVTGINTAEIVFNPSRFWMYLPVTLLFIPLQSATEEIAVRGYLNQGIGHFIKNPWIVFFITSAAFAALHLGNPEIAESTKETSLLIAISGYFFFGFFACVLTYIDGGLESAIGLHAANNMFAACIVGYDNSALPTPTIFKIGLDTQLDSLTVLVAFSLVCLIMYKTRTLFERVERVE
ncbi:MAG: CPBP family intramembrane metalloprotease [Rhodobacteraceae bacterium]|nr:CPBP family intramembrane metalloprotease [Paracoccaceae bacterium]